MRELWHAILLTTVLAVAIVAIPAFLIVEFVDSGGDLSTGVPYARAGRVQPLEHLVQAALLQVPILIVLEVLAVRWVIGSLRRAERLRRDRALSPRRKARAMAELERGEATTRSGSAQGA